MVSLSRVHDHPRSSSRFPLTLHTVPTGPTSALLLVRFDLSSENPAYLYMTFVHPRFEPGSRWRRSQRPENCGHDRTHATVRSHVKKLHRKLGVHTQADLVRLVLSTAGLPRG